MRLAYIGNGPFAVPSLERLARESRFTMVRVIARPDRPQGKKRQILPGPVAQLARDRQLELEQPEDINAPESLERLAGLAPDLLIVADFGQILSPACLATAKLGGINIHGSLLPKYRGAAPVARAILAGESESGISIIQMNSKVDAGGVLLQSKLPILPDETAGELEARLADLGAEAIVEAIDLLARGEAHFLEQDTALATRARKLRKEEGDIDWTWPAQRIHDFIRGLQPWPSAWTHLERTKPGSGKDPARSPIGELGSEGSRVRLQILRSRVGTVAASGQAPSGTPGEVIEVSKSRIRVACSAGDLELLTVLPSGKSALAAVDWARGVRLEVGQRFVRIS